MKKIEHFIIVITLLLTICMIIKWLNPLAEFINLKDNFQMIHHTQMETEIKFNNFYNKYLKNEDVLGMTKNIREMISYKNNWGENDPIWYGLTNYNGNCYVHAMLLKKALDKKGIENYLIYTTDHTHYWNLVKEGDIYRHYDSTSGNHLVGPVNDDEKYESIQHQHHAQRDWDRNLFPKAE